MPVVRGQYRPLSTRVAKIRSVVGGDRLWAELEPLLIIDKPRKKPGRPRRVNRAIFDGLMWLARTGSQWSQVPRRFGPKLTVHLRFTEWVETGALERAWAVLLREVDADLGLDWEWHVARLE